MYISVNKNNYENYLLLYSKYTLSFLRRKLNILSLALPVDSLSSLTIHNALESDGPLLNIGLPNNMPSSSRSSAIFIQLLPAALRRSSLHLA